VLGVIEWWRSYERNRTGPAVAAAPA